MQVHKFSDGMLNPGLGYLMSCLGAFLGLRCLTRARAYTGRTRAIWLLLASVAIGATGMIIAMSPNEDEIRADATLSERLAPEPAAQDGQLTRGDRWESFVSLAFRAWPVRRRIRDSNS